MDPWIGIPALVHVPPDAAADRAARILADAGALVADVNGLLEPARVRIAFSSVSDGRGDAPHVLNLRWNTEGDAVTACRRRSRLEVGPRAGARAVAHALCTIFEIAASDDAARLTSARGTGTMLARPDLVQMRAAVGRLYGIGDSGPIPFVPWSAEAPAVVSSPLKAAAPLTPAAPAAVAMPYWLQVGGAARPLPPARLPAEVESTSKPQTGTRVIRVEAHLLRAGGRYNSRRSEENARRLLREASAIWEEQADIRWQVASVAPLEVRASDLDRLLAPNGALAAREWPAVSSDTLHIYCVGAFPEIDRKADRRTAVGNHAMSAVFVADYFQTVYDYVAIARQTGFLLGLSLRSGPGFLMVKNSNARGLSPAEVATARAGASRWMPRGLIG